MTLLPTKDLAAIQKGEYTSSSLEWGGYEFGDSGFEEAVRLLLNSTHKITHLNLHCTNLTFNDIKHLINLHFLEDLILEGTSIGDEGLVLLLQMENLKKLSIAACGITTDGFKKFLETHQGIKEIDASENAIGEESLEPVVTHRNLRKLALKSASSFKKGQKTESPKRNGSDLTNPTPKLIKIQ